MTTSIPNKPDWKIAAGIPLLIFLGCFLITGTAKFRLNSNLLSNAILGDLLITAPLVYLLTIRKTSVPKITTIRVFIVGVFVAGLILNRNANPVLSVIKTFISPVIELAVIYWIGQKFYTANKKAKAENTTADFLPHCRRLITEVTGNEKISILIASEIAVIYYAFFSSRDKSVDYKNKFSSYKENGIIIVLVAILSIFIIETAGMHFLFSLWSKTAAWILTALSLYTCIQLFAHTRAIKARPIAINEFTLNIHNGLAGDAIIPFELVEKIECSNKKPTNRQFIKISLLNAMENHNMIVYLRQPIEVTKVFGIKKQTDTVLFFVDKPKEFYSAIQSRLPTPGHTTTTGTMQP